MSLYIVNFGLSKASLATVGYALYDADGDLHTARTTTGVTERPTGTGIYGVDLTLTSGWSGEIRWDTGEAIPSYASEVIDGSNQEPYVDPGTVSLYCTYTDINNELNDLSDHIPANQSADPTGWVEAQIYKCMLEIDGRLGGLYTVPFTSPIPSLVRTICIYLSTSRILSPGYVGEIPADSRYVDTYYKRADDLLKRIESGDITLTGTSVVSGGINSLGIASTSTDIAQTFTQTTYDVDGNILESGSMEGW